MRNIQFHSPALCLLLFASLANAQSIALTFDDGPDMADQTARSAAQRNSAILAQLADAGVKSMLFVTRMNDDRARNELIAQWGKEGHRIGNHTATHLNFEATSLVDFEQDFRACDQAIRGIPGFAPRFRFPYLKEGETIQKRDGFRAFLNAAGYAPGPVSVDASDWYYNQRLRDRLRKNPRVDRLAFRDAYLRHLLDRAHYYDGLSQATLGRSVAHVLLLHHNLINALFLSDVIHLFRAKGWRIIDAETAFQDPVYAMRTDLLPAGESILWALAKQKGIHELRYPAEDDVYEKPILDRLHL